MDQAERIRVGIVDFLNSRPLAWGFLRGTVDPRLEAVYRPPSAVADLLAAGEIEVGLVPTFELLRIPGLRILPGLCVASEHEVRSVLLVSRVPPEDIRRVALDEHSRTSAALVRILLREVHGVDAEYTVRAPHVDEMLRANDAALVIGDPALQLDRTKYRILDLAEAWRSLTGHPFVFAVWAVRDGVDLAALAGEFSESLHAGMADLERIIADASAELDLAPEAVRAYLTSHLRFSLGPAELEGMREFFARCEAAGLVDSVPSLRFWS